MPAAAGVAGGGEAPARTGLDGRHAAEVEVEPAPADDVVTERGEPIRRAARLDVHLGALEVEARRRDRLGDRKPVTGDVRHDLEDRAAQANRAGAAEDEPRAALLEH